jgi:hypothetical protein
MTSALGFLRSRVHPLMSLTPSSEYVTTSHLLNATRASSASPGVTVSPSRHQYEKSTLRQVSQTCLCSVLNVSRAHDGLLLFAPCRLISSPYHVRDSLFRGLLPIISRPDSSPARTLLPFTPFSCCRVTPTAPDCETRLQGFNPTTGPLSLTGGLDLPAPRSPLEFSLLRAFLRTPCDYPRSLSAHDLLVLIPRVTPIPGLQRINRCPAFPSVSRIPSHSSFLASL